nr:deoxynucleotidyltransferase terminal-interacting protein 1 isoform X3 [Halyomorpha halys]
MPLNFQMVVWRSPSANITQIKMMDSLEALKEIEGMTSLAEKEIKEISMIAWKNAHDMRPVTLAALANSKTSRPHNTLSKMRYRNMTSAAKSLDILRQNLQAAINKEIDLVIKKYLEKFFQPAVRNIRENLGAGSVTEDLIREVCRAMLEEAKQMYCSVTLHKSTSPPADTEFQTPDQTFMRKRKASDSEREIPQRSRNYPPYIKWDPSRVNKDTQFILSTTASKILGYMSLKGRTGLKNPDLVKYMVDQDDREWLTTAGIPGLMQGTPNAALFLLEDIVQLANFEEYRSNALLHASELKGFVLPDFIQRKVRAYMTLMRTKYIEPEVTTTPLPSPPPDPLERISPHFLDDIPLAYDELHLLDSSESTLQELSPSISEDAIFGLNCIDPCNTLQSVEENQPTIQMSVGVGVECLPSIITPLAMLETELEPSFMAIRGGETED